MLQHEDRERERKRNMLSMLTSYRCHLQPCSHYHLELSCKKWRRPSWGWKLEREWKKCEKHGMAWHTGEDEWSRRQSKSSLSWDTPFWGPHEGPSSQQLLCSYLMLLSPPSLSLSLSLSLTISISISLTVHFFPFTSQLHTQHTFFSSSKTVFDLSKSTMLCLTSTEKPSSSLSLSLFSLWSCDDVCLFVCIFIWLR